MADLDPDRLARAVAFATRAHAGQTRKGDAAQAPYVCHLLIVAGFVLEHGGDEDQAIAGLLHDALEDCADVTHETLTEAFGEAVATIVADCTDTLPGDTPESKGPWKERKQRYLDHLSEASDASVLVSACDKRHNLSSMVGDLRTRGLNVLGSFKGTPEDQVWYYREILRRITGRVPLRLQVELEALCSELRTLIQAGDTQRFKDTDAE